MKFTVKMRGTCGELSQGFFCGGNVTLHPAGMLSSV